MGVKFPRKELRQDPAGLIGMAIEQPAHIPPSLPHELCQLIDVEGGRGGGAKAVTLNDQPDFPLLVRPHGGDERGHGASSALAIAFARRFNRPSIAASAALCGSPILARFPTPHSDARAGRAD